MSLFVNLLSMRAPSQNRYGLTDLKAMYRILLLIPVVLLNHSLIIPIITDTYISKKLDLDNNVFTVRGQAFSVHLCTIFINLDGCPGMLQP